MNRWRSRLALRQANLTPRWAFLILVTALLSAAYLTPTIRPALGESAHAQDPYPAPDVPQVDPVLDGTPAAQSTEPYPSSANDSPGVIGSDSAVAPANAFVQSDTAAPTQAEPVASPAGLYFLWGGFIAALLIFITAVVGSVVLFARRVE